MSRDELTRAVAEDLEAFCSAGPDRHVGGPGGAAANTRIATRLAELGYTVERLPFSCVDWKRGGATLSVGKQDIAAWEGPYSFPVSLVDAQVVAASTEEELGALEDARGKVLFLHGTLVADQLTPRNYPFYQWESHQRILRHLDRLCPAAVVAATGSNPGIVGALSPYPYIEDADFALPSAYIKEVDAEKVLRGGTATIEIDSDRFGCEAEQVVGVMGAGSPRRVVLSAHIDSRFGTPGALDNAGGVACVLAAASIIATSPPTGLTVEIAPFNGEDNFAAYGEMAYLESRANRFDDIALAINVDAAGFRGHNTAVSTYGLLPHQSDAVERLLASYPTVEPGPQWPASDHMIFAMKGVPALAVTTSAFAEVTSKYTHTAADVPEIVDPALLADAAEWIADLVAAADRWGDVES